jgi:ribosomal-protein-alanine N-acetyltransferase
LQTNGNPARAIGWISLRVNDRTPHIGEIGYSLIEDARGFGYATEALTAAIDEAFGAGELEEMQACCVPENLSSRAVLNRTGFSEERTIRGGAVIRGRHVDVVLYRMTRSEWRRLAMPATRRQMRS